MEIEESPGGCAKFAAVLVGFILAIWIAVTVGIVVATRLFDYLAGE